MWLVAALAIAVVDTQRVAAQAPQLLESIALPGVAGRLDHLAIDTAHGRLFIAALGNHSVEVVDLASATRVHSIRGLHEPQGVVLLSDSNRVAVTNGGSGTVAFFDAATFARVGELRLGSDADNARYDPAQRQLVVGYGDGALAIIDADTATVRARIPLPAHPESFQLVPDGDRIYVNVPGASEVVVVSRKSARIAARWPLTVHANYPMALAPAGSHLLIAARRPPTLMVLASDSGGVLATTDACGDADDLYLDPGSGRVFMSCGAGVIDVFAADDSGAYRRIEQIPTAAGARTSLLATESHRLYVAVPRSASAEAAIRVYQLP